MSTHKLRTWSEIGGAEIPVIVEYWYQPRELDTDTDAGIDIESVCDGQGVYIGGRITPAEYEQIEQSLIWELSRGRDE